MKNLPQIKIYEIDYKFILKNYLDKKLWKKEWTIFAFKNYVFTLKLSKINVDKDYITFNITLKSDLDFWFNTKTSDLDYYFQNMNIDDLKRLIKNKMCFLIDLLEDSCIEYNDENYSLIEDSREEEQKTLRDIANDFLDDNNVSNEEIREAYIEKYINDNEMVWKRLREYKEENKYTKLTDLWLIFAETTDNLELKEHILEAQKNDITEIRNEINEFIEYLHSEDYKTDMKESLEMI